MTTLRLRMSPFLLSPKPEPVGEGTGSQPALDRKEADVGVSPPFPVPFPTWRTFPSRFPHMAVKTQKARPDPEWGPSLFSLPVLTQVRPLGVTHQDSLLLLLMRKLGGRNESPRPRPPRTLMASPDPELAGPLPCDGQVGGPAASPQSPVTHTLIL